MVRRVVWDEWVYVGCTIGRELKLSVWKCMLRLLVVWIQEVESPRQLLVTLEVSFVTSESERLVEVRERDKGFEVDGSFRACQQLNGYVCRVSEPKSEERKM